MKGNTPHHQRIYTFDLLRGLAVLTMILAHSVYFFHNRDSDFLVSVEGFGNTVSFVTFLLVSGAVAAVAYGAGHRSGGISNRRRVVTRIGLLLVAYYLLALMLVAVDILRVEGFDRLRLVLNILTFRHLPGFTEYFPPFIFYSAMLVAVPRFFAVATRTLIRVILVAAAAYGTGWALYQLPIGPLLRPWVALLAGAEGHYRFPLLQYFPVFLLGLYWGQRVLTSEGLRAKARFSWQFGGFFALLAIGAAAWSLSGGPALPQMFLRWPPSVPFLALGLGSAFVVAALLYAARQLRSVRLVRDILLTFGQNALGLFWSHIFLLGLYAIADGPKVSTLPAFIFLWLLVVVLSLALTTFLPFNFRLALTAARGSHEEEEEALAKSAVFRLSEDVATDAATATSGLRKFFFPDPRTTSRRKLRARHKLGITVAVFLATAAIFPATIQEIAIQEQEQGSQTWWSKDYAYRQQVTMKNSESFTSLKPGTVVAMRFDHQQLVDTGRSAADGHDVRLVYWTGREHLVADSYVANPASDQARLIFRAPVQIRAGAEERFYSLYYGGYIELPPDRTFEVKATVIAEFSSAEAYPLIAGVAKRWSLIGYAADEDLTFNLTTAKPYTAPVVTYKILGTDLTGPMVQSSDTSWEATIPVGSLGRGTYRLQATVQDGDRQYHSQYAGFFRSAPLYVAWTIDWEGYDASQAYLEAMETIANHYAVPMTHFFNPRIYITKTISPQRAAALTAWVQRRIAIGDGYGLHLHMFTDFVEYVGLEPKLEPNWGDSGNGYGVPLTAYSQAEQTTMIRAARDLLEANGFGRTDIFRAGGWFNNLETLAALETVGFTVDSSARTSYSFGRNKLPGFWRIRPTTPPYYPSRTDQNRSSGTNDFPILEIPDNGADSYAFSAAAMIDRFTENFGGGLLSDKQQVTFLSHPHWFDGNEQARMRETLAHVSRFSYADDRGPVVFTTTKGIADAWTNVE